MAAIMAPTFPSIVLMGLNYLHNTVVATGEYGGLAGAIYDDGEKGRYNIMGKIEIETAKVDSRYVHLRFTHTNKYWSRNNDGLLVAHSTEAEEDTSKPSCTMFEPRPLPYGGYFELIHVQSGYRVYLEGTPGRGHYVAKSGSESHWTLSTIDWDSMVSLPPNVAFKGSNGKYLRYYKLNNRPAYMQFASEDPNEQGCVHQVELTASGNVRIKCNGGYWRLEPDWIIPDGQGDNWNSYHMAYKGANNKIALKNRFNNLFCRSLTAGGLTDTLNARAPTMMNEALMEVEELVSERSITNVVYRMDEARIYGETPFVGGQTTLTNITDQDASQTATITYTNGKAYTFSRGFSLKAGVSTSIRTGLAFITDVGITVSFEATATLNWDTTTTTETSVTASGTVMVPARSSIVIRYVGTQGTCSIPYSYSQQDRSSVTGQISDPIPQVDGIYNGVSCYNFNFVAEEVLPL